MPWLKDVYCELAALSCESDATVCAFEKYEGPKVEYSPPFQWGKNECWTVKWKNFEIPGDFLTALRKSGFLVGENIAWVEHGKEKHESVRAFVDYITGLECVFLRHHAHVTFCSPVLTFPKNRQDIGDILAASFKPIEHLEKYKI